MPLTNEEATGLIRAIAASLASHPYQFNITHVGPIVGLQAGGAAGPGASGGGSIVNERTINNPSGDITGINVSPSIQVAATPDEEKAAEQVRELAIALEELADAVAEGGGGGKIQAVWDKIKGLATKPEAILVAAQMGMGLAQLAEKIS